MPRPYHLKVTVINAVGCAMQQLLSTYCVLWKFDEFFFSLQVAVWQKKKTLSI